MYRYVACRYVIRMPGPANVHAWACHVPAHMCTACGLDEAAWLAWSAEGPKFYVQVPQQGARSAVLVLCTLSTTLPCQRCLEHSAWTHPARIGCLALQ